jgi:murein DD-endopeptidase MepM/ murein hydrolase activator NlpD
MKRLLGILGVVYTLFCANSLLAFHNNNNNNNNTKKDTLPALVVNTSLPEFENFKDFSGEDIVNLIDSLLDSESIPYELIKEINDYAEKRHLEHDFYVSLTAFYDSSAIPASSFYGKWDNHNPHPYDETICADDTSLLLVLRDSAHFCDYVHPFPGVITSKFGWRNGRNHNGIDIDLEVWDPVVAAFDGMVRVSKYHDGYGRVVIIRHYNGLETVYAHLHRLKVKPGDIVQAGQVIGLGGSSGTSTGSHLHFEVRFKGKALNPQHIINFKTQQLYSDTVVLEKQKWNYTAVPEGVKFHTIEYGDFLYKIATRYGLTVNELCDLNGITRKHKLYAGRKLRVSE